MPCHDDECNMYGRMTEAICYFSVPYRRRLFLSFAQSEPSGQARPFFVVGFVKKCESHSSFLHYSLERFFDTYHHHCIPYTITLHCWLLLLSKNPRMPIRVVMSACWEFLPLFTGMLDGYCVPQCLFKPTLYATVKNVCLLRHLEMSHQANACLTVRCIGTLSKLPPFSSFTSKHSTRR